MNRVFHGRPTTFRGFALSALLAPVAFACAPAPAYANDSEMCRATIAFENVDVIVETGYYQNASLVGGTALAAYPNVRVRYGVDGRVDVFYDAPPEVAKSGIGGVGIYKYEHSGLGAKWAVEARPNFALAVSGEVGPPNAPLSILDARERYTLDVRALGRVGKFDLGSMVAFFDGQRFGRYARSEFNVRDGASVGYDVDKLTRATAEVLTQAGSRRNRAHAYSFGDVFLQRRLAPAVLFDVEIGTSFDPVRNTKPHYIGAGISFVP